MLEHLAELLKEAVDYGLQTLAISGGEPLLSPIFLDLLKTCENLSLKNLFIYTSGVMKDGKGKPIHIPNLYLSEIFKSDAILVFSVPSTEKAIFTKFVGSDMSFDLTFRSMRNAISMGIPVECNIVPNQINLDDLESTAHELLGMGVQKINFLRLVPQGYAKQNIAKLSLSSSSMKQRFQEIVNDFIKDDPYKNKYRFGIPFSWYCDCKAACDAGVSKLIMRWDGRFLPCEAFKESGYSEFSLGQLGQENLHQILENAYQNQALLNLKKLAEGKEACPAQLLYK
jgi:radical SAM protein with 4Fe4S-binding SPASM domain